MNVAHFWGGFIFFVEFICFHGCCDFLIFFPHCLFIYLFSGRGRAVLVICTSFFFFLFLLVNFREKLYICVMVSVDFSNH